jgi:signal peptidase I
MKGLVKDFLVSALLALTVFFILQAILLQCVVQQTSMTPTLVEGQRIFINKTAYIFESPQRGDIIVFHPSDKKGGIPLIKRVIGLHGEHIAVKDWTVFIDESPLDEPYLKELPEYELKDFTVADNRYFVLGDNRNGSYDSHFGWTVEREMIIGKAWVCIWPPDLLGPAPNYAFADD